VGCQTDDLHKAVQEDWHHQTALPAKIAVSSVINNHASSVTRCVIALKSTQGAFFGGSVPEQ
jgi:hypothetical protein